MKVKSKILVGFLIILILSVIILPVSTYATMPDFDSMKQDADKWLDKGKSKTTLTPDKVANLVKPVAQILLVIGTIVLLVSAIVMGIKYMTASPEEAAKIKTQLIGLVIAAIVIFGSYGIWSIVYTFMTSVTH